MGYGGDHVEEKGQERGVFSTRGFSLVCSVPEYEVSMVIVPLIAYFFSGFVFLCSSTVLHCITLSPFLPDLALFRFFFCIIRELVIPANYTCSGDGQHRIISFDLPVLILRSII